MSIKRVRAFRHCLRFGNGFPPSSALGAWGAAASYDVIIGFVDSRMAGAGRKSDIDEDDALNEATATKTTHSMRHSSARGLRAGACDASELQ